MLEVQHTAQYSRGGGSETNKDHAYFTAGESRHFCIFIQNGCIIINLPKNPCCFNSVLFSLQLLPLLDRALGNPSLQNGPFFLLVTEMLISWENRAGLHGWSGSNGSEDVFQKLLEDFWEGLNLLFVRYTDNEEADPKALEGVATLLQVSVSIGNLRCRCFP